MSDKVKPIKFEREEKDMKTSTVETSKLSGPALDWAAAKAVGLVAYTQPDGPVYLPINGEAWSPSTDWSQGGPLIEKLEALTQYDDSSWYAIPTSEYGVIELSGPTPLIAICRAIVAAELGDDVEVPVELLEELEKDMT